MPVRNEVASLPACIRALNDQTLERDRYEILFVDGASTDGSWETIRRAGVRVLRVETPGVSNARNAGAALAHGDVLAFTDADCRPEPDWLERIDARLTAEPHLAGVGGAIRHPSTTRFGRVEDARSRANYRGFITSNVAYRARSFWRVGGFDPRLHCAEDSDLAWRILDAGERLGFEPDAIVWHDTPEEDADAATYFLKHYWYARNDVPACVAHARRLVAENRFLGGAGSRGPWGHHCAAAAADAATVAAVAAGILAGSPIVVGAALAVTAARGLSMAVDVHRRVEDANASILELATTLGGRCLARGLGTVAGAATAARVAGSDRLTRGPDPGLARPAASAPPAPPSAAPPARPPRIPERAWGVRAKRPS